MGNHELEDVFETARKCHSTISNTPNESDEENDEYTARDFLSENEQSSRIDIDSISIALGNTPSTSVSTCSADHKTKRNILSVQKEEAFQDWLAAKKFVSHHPSVLVHNAIV